MYSRNISFKKNLKNLGILKSQQLYVDFLYWRTKMLPFVNVTMQRELDQKNYISRILNGFFILDDKLAVTWTSPGLVVNGMCFMHKLQKQVVGSLL